MTSWLFLCKSSIFTGRSESTGPTWCVHLMLFQLFPYLLISHVRGVFINFTISDRRRRDFSFLKSKGLLNGLTINSYRSKIIFWCYNSLLVVQFTDRSDGNRLILSAFWFCFNCSVILHANSVFINCIIFDCSHPDIHVSTWRFHVSYFTIINNEKMRTCYSVWAIVE